MRNVWEDSGNKIIIKEKNNELHIPYLYSIFKLCVKYLYVCLCAQAKYSLHMYTYKFARLTNKTN